MCYICNRCYILYGYYKQETRQKEDTDSIVLLQFGEKSMKQSDKSKLWMEEALLQLMEKKEFATITVTDICEKAGISRLTFYRNFEVKEDILRFHFDKVFQEYIGKFDEGITNIEEAITSCFDVWFELREEIKRIVDSNLALLMYEPFSKYTQIVLSKNEKYKKCDLAQQNFILGGMFALMVSMVNHPTDRKPEEITSSIMELLK